MTGEAGEPELDGVVSLGMGPRADDVKCSVCGHHEALVTHTADGRVAHVCADCGHGWLTGEIEPRIVQAVAELPLKDTESPSEAEDGGTTPYDSYGA